LTLALLGNAVASPVSSQAASPGAPSAPAFPTVGVALTVSACSFTVTYTWSGFAAGSVMVIQGNSFSVGVFSQHVKGTSGTLSRTFGPLAKEPGFLNTFRGFGQLSDDGTGLSVDASVDFSGEASTHCKLIL
jgi:hypothetical protein